MIRGIAFDLEGTVVDVESLHFGAHVRAATEFGFAVDFEMIVAKIPHAIGGGDRLISEGIARISKNAGLALGVEDLFEAKKRHYVRLLEEVELQPRPGFINIFRWIAEEACLPVAVGSLTLREQAKVLLHRSGLDQLFRFDRVVLLEDVGEANKKPKPDVYLETAKRMGIRSEEQLIFEDSPVGVKAARAAGSLAIGMPIFRTPENIAGILEAGACRIFFDWREMNIAAVIRNLQAKM